MVYLHKSVFQSHGYLSSSNCHVDNRWVLKVSGFSLHAFRNDTLDDQVNTDYYFSFVTKEQSFSKGALNIFFTKI